MLEKGNSTHGGELFFEGSDFWVFCFWCGSLTFDGLHQLALKFGGKLVGFGFYIFFDVNQRLDKTTLFDSHVALLNLGMFMTSKKHSFTCKARYM